MVLNGLFFSGVGLVGRHTLPETNIPVAPKNGCLEYDPFLLGFRPIFKGLSQNGFIFPK